MSKTRKTSDENKQSASQLLRDTPIEVRCDVIYPHFSLTTLGAFAQTSKQAERETVFLRLLQAAINATPEFMTDEKGSAFDLASIAILKKHPELLFRKKQLTDHYGRQILASPYQLFLGAGDVWGLKQVHKDILPLLDVEMQKKADIQFKEQFPDYDKELESDMYEEARFYDARNKQQIIVIMKQLATITQSINTDPFNNNLPSAATTQAVEALGQLLQPKPNEVIKSGLHFPLVIMKEIYKTYSALQRKGCTFFSLDVIKPALDALSTVDGQCCQFGLMALDMAKGPLRRCGSSYQHPFGKPLSLTLVSDEDKLGAAVLIDPYKGDVCYHSSVDGLFLWLNKNGVIWNGVAWTIPNGLPGRGWPLLAGDYLEILWRAKAETIQSYYANSLRCVNTPSR